MFQQDICNITPSYFAIMTYTTMDYISFTWHFITLPGLWFFGESLVLKNYIRPVGSQKPRLKYNKVLKSLSSITFLYIKSCIFNLINWYFVWIMCYWLEANVTDAIKWFLSYFLAHKIWVLVLMVQSTHHKIHECYHSATCKHLISYFSFPFHFSYTFTFNFDASFSTCYLIALPNRMT